MSSDEPRHPVSDENVAAAGRNVAYQGPKSAGLAYRHRGLGVSENRGP